MIQLDIGDHRPIYEQICSKFKELIINGVLREGDKIPSVRDLASSLAINPNTIQKAYKELENEGYIYSQKAKGSFVCGEIDGDSTKLKELENTLVSVIGVMRFLGEEQDRIIKLLDDIYKEG